VYWDSGTCRGVDVSCGRRQSRRDNRISKVAISSPTGGFVNVSQPQAVHATSGGFWIDRVYRLLLPKCCSPAAGQLRLPRLVLLANGIKMWCLTRRPP